MFTYSGQLSYPGQLLYHHWLSTKCFLISSKRHFMENVDTNSLHFLLRPIPLSQPIVLPRPIVYYRWSSPCLPPPVFYPGIQQNPLLYDSALSSLFLHSLRGLTKAGQGSKCHLMRRKQIATSDSGLFCSSYVGQE